MIKKLTLIIVCLGLLWGCAGMQPQRTFENSTFTSDFPELCVKIHRSYIFNQGKESKRYRKSQVDRWWWEVAGGTGVGIVINRYHKSTSLDYYYSLERITRNMGRIPLETLLINDHRWLKYAYVNEQKHLHTGFFTRKDDCFISVYRYTYFRYRDEIEELDTTRTMTDSQKKLLNIVFNETDKLFAIEY
jgi:hypothetical protein